VPRLYAVLIALVLGALVNIAIAWYFGSTPAADNCTVSGSVTTTKGPLVFHVFESPARHRCLCTLTPTPQRALDAGFSGGGIPRSTFSATATPPSWSFPPQRVPPSPLGAIDPAVVYSSIASGWPMLSMVQHSLPKTGAPPTLRDRIRRGIESPFANKTFWSSRQYLALLPIWLGFAVNTLVYALPVYGVTWSIAILRSRLRRRAGRCPRCEYDIRGIASPCPECGSPF
jgi:hypothetical protein